MFNHERDMYWPSFGDLTVNKIFLKSTQSFNRRFLEMAKTEIACSGFNPAKRLSVEASKGQLYQFLLQQQQKKFNIEEGEDQVYKSSVCRFKE